MGQLFKEKVSRFGSLISLITVCGVLVLFFLALPETLTSAAGKVFAVIWALTAILAFIAHARRLSSVEHRYQPRYFADKSGYGKRQSGRRLARG